MKLTDSFTLRTASNDSDDVLMLLAGIDEIERIGEEHTCLFLVENEEIIDKHIVRWTSTGLVNLGPKKFLVFGDRGQYILYDKGGHREGNAWNESDGKFKGGIMRSGAISSSGVFWVGYGGRVLLYDLNGKWMQYDYHTEDDFEGVLPTQDGGFLAYGWQGCVAKLGDHYWENIETPTNLILTNGCATPEGDFVLVGQHGIIMRGNDEGWRIVADEETNQDIWGVTYFQDKLYLSTMQFLYEVTSEGDLQLVQFDDSIPETCCHLISSSSRMWSIGNKSLFVFIDGSWKELFLSDPLEQIHGKN